MSGSTKLEVEQVVAVNPRGQLVPVAAAMHEVRENPQAARQLFEQVVWDLPARRAVPGEGAANLRSPDKKLILAQNRRERDRQCAVSESPVESESSFWSRYLRNIAFWRKPRTTGPIWTWWAGFAGPCPPGRSVLDAGCGNGLFGLWCCREVWQRQTLAPADNRLFYVGA